LLKVNVLVHYIEPVARLVEPAGGMIVEPPHEISQGTWICLFNDPIGVTFAMLEERLVAIAGMAALCIGIGLFTKIFYGLLPFPVEYGPYTATHVITSYQLLLYFWER
jgi:hypothetical protein